MLPVAIVRRQVLAVYAVDKYTATAAAEKLAQCADEIAELSMNRIAGAIIALWRHKRTGYDKQLQAKCAHYYDGGRKDTQQATNEPLRAKLESLRIK